MYKGDNENMTQRQSVPLAHILHGNKSQIEAIKELEQLFTLDKSTLFQVIESFQKELNAGLANDRSSDLNMIPSFVTGNKDNKTLSFIFFFSLSFL